MIATAPPPPKAVGAAATVTTPIPKEQVLRLAEEQLDVGKRMVQEGTTRIRRFVTEKPVEPESACTKSTSLPNLRASTDPARPPESLSAALALIPRTHAGRSTIHGKCLALHATFLSLSSGTNTFTSVP